MSLLPSVLALGLLMGGPAGPKTNVEPQPKPAVKAAEAPTGQLIVGVVFRGRGPRFATGGKWTRTEPFWVRARLGEFVVVQWICYEPPQW